jgi:Aldehyde dehydrogenase family
LLVQRQVYEANLQILGAMANQVKVGDPMDGTTNMGPVISVAALDRILARVDQGQSDGARLIAGGARIGGDHAGGRFCPSPSWRTSIPIARLLGKKCLARCWPRHRLTPKNRPSPLPMAATTALAAICTRKIWPG